MKIRKLVLGFVVVSLLTITTSNVNACSCIRGITDTEHYINAQAVYTGTVIKSESWEHHILKVNELYKGNLGKTIEMHSMSGNCSTYFELGKEYLVYVHVSDENYSAFLTANLEKYKGKWIILCDEHVIASGENIKKIVNEAQEKCPDKKFLLARVPEEGTMIL